MTQAYRRLAYLNAGLAFLATCGLGWSIQTARRAAAEAVRVYGYNTDSGAYVAIGGFILFAPAILIFVLAAAAFWYEWRSRWVFQGFAAALALLIGFILLAILF